MGKKLNDLVNEHFSWLYQEKRINKAYVALGKFEFYLEIQLAVPERRPEWITWAKSQLAAVRKMMTKLGEEAPVELD